MFIVNFVININRTAFYKTNILAYFLNRNIFVMSIITEIPYSLQIPNRK